MADQQKALSNLRCAGTVCIIVGVISLISVAWFLEAIMLLIIGCSIGCVSNDVGMVKKNLGCPKCCSITVIVFSVLNFIGCAVVGFILYSTVYTACEIIQNPSSSGLCQSNRRLELVHDHGFLPNEWVNEIADYEAKFAEKLADNGFGAFMPKALVPPKIYRFDSATGREVQVTGSAAVKGHPAARRLNARRLNATYVEPASGQDPFAPTYDDSAIGNWLDTNWTINGASCPGQDIMFFSEGDLNCGSGRDDMYGGEGSTCFGEQGDYFQGYCSFELYDALGSDAYWSGVSVCARCTGDPVAECENGFKAAGRLCGPIRGWATYLIAAAFALVFLQLIAGICACCRIGAVEQLPDAASAMTGVQAMPTTVQVGKA